LVWAILSTVFCCLPLGLVAIVNSTRVSGLWSQGLHAEAEAAAKKAKRWTIISVVAWAILALGAIILWVIFVIFAVSESENNHHGGPGHSTTRTSEPSSTSTHAPRHHHSSTPPSP